MYIVICYVLIVTVVIQLRLFYSSSLIYMTTSYNEYNFTKILIRKVSS